MTAAKTEGFRWLPSYYEAIRDLPECERLLICDAILDYGFGNEVGELPPLLAGYFRLIVPTLDRSVKFETKQKANGKKGGRPKQTEENPDETQNEFGINPDETQNEFGENLALALDNDIDSAFDVAEERAFARAFDGDGVKDLERADRPRRAARFSPPSVDDVRDYCLERRRYIDSERFVNYYAAKGWRIGGEPMTDWRAAVRSWESRQEDFDARVPDG